MRHTKHAALLIIPVLLGALALTPRAQADPIDDYNQHAHAANAAVDAKDWPTVVTEATASLALSDSASLTKDQIGRIYGQRAAAEFELHDMEAAGRDYRGALANVASDYNLWRDAGVTEHALGHDRDAVDDYTRGLALSPPADGKWDMVYNRGLAYQGEREWHKAIADFTDYLDAKGPKAASARLHRAESYFKLADAKDKASPEIMSALDDANFLMAQKDISVSVLYLRGDILAALGEDARALADYTVAVDNAPAADKPQALQKRVDFYGSRHDTAHAIADLSTLIALSPTDVLYDQRAAYHYNAGQYPEAVADYRASQKLYPSPFTLGHLVDALVLAGDYPGAIKVLDDKIVEDPKPEANVWYAHRGHLRYHQGDWAGAADDFTNSIKDRQYFVDAVYHGVPTTDLAQAYAYRARALAHKGDITAANLDIDQALKIAPEDADVLLADAEVERVRTDYAAALAALDKIVAKDDKNSAALYLRAQVSLAQGKVVEAKADDAAARALDPNLPPLAFPIPKPPAKPAPAKAPTPKHAPVNRKAHP